MASVCPGLYQFANELGVPRQEYVASVINTNQLIQNSPQCENTTACQFSEVTLVIPESVTKTCQKGVTTTLVDPSTASEVIFPAGTFFEKIVIFDKTCGNLDCRLSFMLGYLSDCVSDPNNLAALAQLIAGIDTQITGNLFNAGNIGQIEIDNSINASIFATLINIFNAEDVQHCANIDTFIAGELNILAVNNNNAVGIPKELKIAITVTSGQLCCQDIEFHVCFRNRPCVCCSEPPCTHQPCQQSARHCGRSCAGDVPGRRRSTCG